MDEAINFLLVTITWDCVRITSSSRLWFYIFAGDSKPTSMEVLQVVCWGLSWGVDCTCWATILPACGMWSSCWWMLFSPRITGELIPIYYYAKLGVISIEVNLEGDTWFFIIFLFLWEVPHSYQSTKIRPSQFPFLSASFQLPVPGPEFTFVEHPELSGHVPTASVWIF